MGIEQYSERIILVDLPKEPDMEDELKNLFNLLQNEPKSVIIDFSAVRIITGPSRRKLLEVRQQILNSRNRLVLCSLAPATRGLFHVMGLHEAFEMASDRFAAISNIEAGT